VSCCMSYWFMHNALGNLHFCTVCLVHYLLQYLVLHSGYTILHCTPS